MNLIFFSLPLLWLLAQSDSLSKPGAESHVVYVTETGSAEFTSTVPLHAFTGRSDHLHGYIDFEENVVDFYLDLSTLKTGNSRRDRDMYQTLNIEVFPFTEFTGSLDTEFDFSSDEKQHVSVTGEFSIHGVVRMKTVYGTLHRQEEEIHLEAAWIQDITDHEIEPPGILFYRVRDEMDVHIQAVLQMRERETIQNRPESLNTTKKQSHKINTRYGKTEHY